MKIEEEKVAFGFLSKLNLKDKSMIDVGAHYGISLMPFAKNDWKVWALEPDDANRKILFKNLKEAKITIERIDAFAVTNFIGEANFYNSTESSGISGLIPFHQSHQISQKVNTTTISEYCNINKIDKVDFIKIDTEGNDHKVLEGINFELIKPVIILYEFEDRKSPIKSGHLYSTIEYMKTKGYSCIISEWRPIKAYGKRHKWKQFTTSYKNVNPAGWGNVFAVQNEKYDDFLNYLTSKLKHEVTH